MKCSICGEGEVIKIYRRDKVKFQCKKGHTWFEEYSDNGGCHRRPYSYEIQIEDTLFPSEKKIYRKLLDDIEKNNRLYNSIDPIAKANLFMENCEITEGEMLNIFRKIRNFESNREEYYE